MALIRLKHERDLTDREIKLLYRTGSLKRDAGIVHFLGSQTMAMAGGLQIAVIFMIFSLLILGVLAQQPLTLRQVVVSVGIAAFLAALEWTLYRIYITPWRIYVRTQANTSAAVPTS